MKSPELVSVIIPVYNSGVFLDEAIQSCLNSTYSNIEIIVVDDGSTDFETLQILRKKQWTDYVTIVHKKNRGPASARNFGARHAKGDFLFFLDSDNLVRPLYFEKAVSISKGDSTIAVVYSRPSFFGSTANQGIRFETRTFDFDALLVGNYIDMCSLVRRDVFLDIGGFDESKDLIGWEDWDLWIRIAMEGWRFHYLDDVLFDYRVRSESLMGSADETRRKEMLKYLGRKHSFVIHQKYRQYFRVMDSMQERPFSNFLRILYYKYFLKKPFIK